MKQRYEERISELEDQLNSAEQEQERLELALNHARRLQTQLSQAGGSASQQYVHTEVLTAYKLV